MAGLFDTVSSGGILDYIRSLDKATEPFMGEFWRGASPAGGRPGGVNLLDYLREVDKRSSTPFPGFLDPATNPSFIGQIVSGRQQPGLNAPQSGDIGMMYGAGQPQAEQPAQPPAPQQPLPPSIASAPMSPQDAEQAFNLPTGSYPFGGQMVPTFGQAQAPLDEASAQRRGVGVVPSVQINPQGNPVSPAAVAPGATSTFQDKTMDFLDRLSPDYVSRYRQTKQQQQTAQNLATFFQSQGMDARQAGSLASVAVQNPKVMEEILKPYPNMEAALASQYGGGAGPGGGDKMTRYMDFIGKKKATETGAEVAGKTAAEAQIALPGGKADVEQTMQVIKELRNHEGRNSIGWHGVTSNVPPEMLRGTKAFAAIKLEDQLKSRTFTDQVKTMVGMGALSNAEGSKITDAVARIDRGLPRAEYDKALDFIEGALRNGIDKMSQKAGEKAPFGFKGGDGWTTIDDVRIRQK